MAKLRHLFLTLTLLLLMLTGCECEQARLSQVCNVPVACYIDRGGSVHELQDPAEYPELYNMGEDSACSLGTTVCDPHTFEVTCEGYVIPETAFVREECNLIDDNCNFLVDEQIRYEYWDPRNTCDNNAGTCKQNQECIAGQFFCQLHTPDSCGEEICDGLDNDGDGDIDEDTPEEPLYAEGYVYQGPPETDLVGECRPGRKECFQGHTIVAGQVLPSYEACGDSKDNDCDGFTDESDDPNSEAAYVFVLDVSGSMLPYLQAVTASVCNFSQNTMLGQSAYAVVLLGSNHPDGINDIIFGLDFTDSEKLCEYMTQAVWIGSGSEFQVRGILAAHDNYYLATDTQSSVVIGGLAWPQGLDKRIIMFSDEEPHYLPGESMDSVVVDCDRNDYSLGVFTPFAANWSYPVSQCGGFLVTLYTDAYNMEQQMLGNLTGGC
jgi:hypothetical protein